MRSWFSQNQWALWLALSLVLAAAEMLTLDLTLLMLAAGALAGAGTAALFPDAIIAQVLVAVVTAALMLFLLRPTLLAKVRNSPGYRNSLNQLLGSIATATADITSSGGEVKVAGQVWNARCLDPTVTVLAGQQVEIFEVDGTTLVVHPADRGLPYGRPS